MYRTKITLTVLSEEPINDRMGLDEIGRECDEGDFVLRSIHSTPEKISDEAMAHELLDAGSDPDFFMIEGVR